MCKYGFSLSIPWNVGSDGSMPGLMINVCALADYIMHEDVNALVELR